MRHDEIILKLVDNIRPIDLGIRIHPTPPSKYYGLSSDSFKIHTDDVESNTYHHLYLIPEESATVADICSEYGTNFNAHFESGMVLRTNIRSREYSGISTWCHLLLYRRPDGRMGFYGTEGYPNPDIVDIASSSVVTLDELMLLEDILE